MNKPDSAKKSLLKEKTVSYRPKNEMKARIEACASALTEKHKTTYRKSNVLEVCVNSYLPLLEKELGIKPPSK